MSNSILWSFAIISGVANVVFYYLLWRAIKENHKLGELLMEKAAAYGNRAKDSTGD